MTTTYRNLITGEPAQQQKHKKDYFELEVVKTAIGNRYATSQGEFLCAYGAHQTFKEAWFDALTYTTVGGDAYQAWESRPLPADPGTEPDSPVYSPVDWAKVPERMSPEELPRFLDD